MKAITILQPFAQLIVADEADLPAGHAPKRVENRNWPTEVRGHVLIHAGRSSVMLAGWNCAGYPLEFGMIVGSAFLYDCVSVNVLRPGDEVLTPLQAAIQRSQFRENPWLRDHVHVVGRFCWILREVRRFTEPLPWKGQQGFFEVPNSAVQSRIETSARPVTECDFDGRNEQSSRRHAFV